MFFESSIHHAEYKQITVSVISLQIQGTLATRKKPNSQPFSSLQRPKGLDLSKTNCPRFKQNCFKYEFLSTMLSYMICILYRLQFKSRAYSLYSRARGFATTKLQCILVELPAGIRTTFHIIHIVMSYQLPKDGVQLTKGKNNI